MNSKAAQIIHLDETLRRPTSSSHSAELVRRWMWNTRGGRVAAACFPPNWASALSPNVNHLMDAFIQMASYVIAGVRNMSPLYSWLTGSCWVLKSSDFIGRLRATCDSVLTKLSSSRGRCCCCCCCVLLIHSQQLAVCVCDVHVTTLLLVVLRLGFY